MDMTNPDHVISQNSGTEDSKRLVSGMSVLGQKDGISVGLIWDQYKKIMGSVWDQYGISMGLKWMDG